jgi:hypothetical protein
MFRIREEYREYLSWPRKEGETALCFRDWFETAYHYDYLDNL